ncbi:type II CRISPR-associated endonuclease Cas1 [Lactiplantibacillus garii]|uniref:CRISPR-associated endonuclease Cas1 n=1 Tax=Lactiplantibacillus garii TaxID=2306423 RepID=A0A426D8K1_9LACO|nr:type II CRISPR-associated endonuclease Cas1 [Lactiplantibacillus garii]RRK10920.1 type II CRISPR-associated endonuclease Cas1 [Lactiplantibacillus garii]
MGWRNMVITQHAKVSYSNRLLIIQTDQDKYHVPITDLQLLLIGTTQAVVTTSAVCALAEAHVKIVFTDHQGEPVCETNDYYPTRRTADLVRKQVAWSTQRVENLWTKITASKITNQIQVIDFIGGDSQELSDELDKLELNDATNREAVVANKYFTLLFGDEFHRRNFDPANAALNYGYALLLSLVNREIVSNGYLTCIGIHHVNNENEFNLGSDLMEPFRPIVDQWVSQQKFIELTPDVKIGLVALLSVEINFNGQQTYLSNAISQHVASCLHFLSEETDEIKVEVILPDEVSSHAINSHV